MDIVATCLLVLGIVYVIWYFAQYEYIESTINGRRYKVLVNKKNSDAAADMLAEIDSRIVRLLRSMKNRHGRDHHHVNNLLERYDPDVVSEHEPTLINNNTAYTHSKGEIIGICLRSLNAEGKPLHDINLIMFVVLHELSHVAADVYQHPIQFWRVFKFVLQEAVIADVYNPVNYADEPTSYCNGMIIDYNPYYHEALSQP